MYISASKMIPKSRSNHEKQLQVEPDTMIRAYSMVDILCNIVFKFRLNHLNSVSWTTVRN